MGDLTRAELREEVVGNLGNDTSFSLDDTSTSEYKSLNRALDRGQVAIVRAHPGTWRELRRSDSASISVVGTPATDAYYTPGITLLHKFHSLIRQETSDEVGVRLIGMLRDAWESLIGQSETLSTGRVTAYVTDRDSGGALRLIWFRVPDTAFTLYRRYSVYPTPLSDGATVAIKDANVSDLENKDDILIAYATAYCFRRLQMYEEEQFWFQSYQTLLAQEIANDQNQPDEQVVGMGHSVGSGSGAQVNYWQDPFNRSSN